MAENNKSMDKGRKLLIGFIIVLLLLTAGAYFFGVSHSHFDMNRIFISKNLSPPSPAALRFLHNERTGSNHSG